MSAPTEEPVDFRAYLRPIAARKWWIVGLVIAVTVATYVKVDHKPKVFEATTSVLIQPSSDLGLFAGGANSALASNSSFREAANQAQLLQSRKVATEVKRDLRSPLPPDVLRSRITVSTDQRTDFVTLKARGPSPLAATSLANAYAQAFVKERTSGIRQELLRFAEETRQQISSLRGDRETINDSRAELSSQLRQAKSAASSPDPGATQVDAALTAARIAPFPKRNAIYAFMLALIVGGVGAVVLEGLNRRLTTAEQLEEAYGLPILASVPHVSNPSPVVEGRAELSGQITEPMRTLRVNINLQTLDDPLKVLLITSATPAEGKTTIVRNLAMVMAEAGTRIVVVEADLRLPTVAKQFGIEVEQGLTDVLLGEADVADTLVRVDAPVGAAASGEIAVLVAGSVAANPPAILGASRMLRTVRELADRFDVVLIDSPPLLAVSDTLSLLPLADGIILVGRIKLSTRDAVQRVNDLLSRSPSGRVLGLVVDDAESPGYDEYAYGYRDTQSSRARKTAGAPGKVTSRS
jgi:receptor protein-tyrosine kinase